jgi:hypothetical protein
MDDQKWGTPMTKRKPPLMAVEDVEELRKIVKLSRKTS